MHLLINNRNLLKQPYLCSHLASIQPLPLGCQKHRIILWALVCPHPGYICIHHFARLLPILITTTTINCNRAQNKHDSQFVSPLGGCFEKLNLLCQARGHQWDLMRLSELRWEMCQQGYICFSAADGEGWPAWPHPINGQTIINVHEAALLVISSTYSWLSLIDKWSIRQLDGTVKRESKR